MRQSCILLACLFSSLASAQAPPPASNEDTLPVMLGLSMPTGKDCSFTAQPGQPGYCLRPPEGMGIWLRADDIWGRVTILTQWKSPPPVRMFANHSGKAGESAWLMANGIGTQPITRFADRSSLQISAADSYANFTLFAVARQAPGSRRGVLVSSAENQGQNIGWTGGNTIAIQTGPGATVSLPFEKTQEFHVLTVRAESSHANVFANGELLNEEAVQLGERFAVQFVGVPTSAVAPGAVPGGLAGFGGFSTRAPVNPYLGSDIAELIVWPRALNEAEMRTTLRYLKRKYQLGFAADDEVLLAANPIPADAAAPDAATPDDTGTKPGSAADPEANYPTTVGQQFMRGSGCKTKSLTPDMPGYCLRPAPASVAWHRADDIFSFERRLSSWRSPLFNELLAPVADKQPELVNAQLGRYPIVRFDNDNSMDFRRPMDLSRYTIFVVGRRAPGSILGPIFRLGAAGNTFMFWRDEGVAIGTTGTKNYSIASYPGVEKFHLLTLRGWGPKIDLAVNSNAVASFDLPEGSASSFKIGHLGGGLMVRQNRDDAIFDALQSALSKSGGRSRISSEIAEIIIYDQVLEPEYIEQTERYLRRKYSLP
jgi:hypothetical protein